VTDVTETDLMPEGETWAADEDVDPSGVDLGDLRVNFSQQEAEASFEELKPGRYLATIFSGEVAFSQSAKNKGKPYWKLRLKVQEGQPQAGASIFDNIMLFEGALYSLSGLMKALGYDISAGQVRVPQLEEIIGQPVGINVRIQPARHDKETGKDYDARSVVKGYWPAKGGARGGIVSQASSLEP
jgi:hypothetical protein